RVIEDISTDGGHTYIIANPGEIDSAAVDDLIAQEIADGILGADEAMAKAALLKAAASFDKPVRRYDGLQITAERRFTRDLMVAASYTLSKLQGNFPGLFSPETGQLDPNLTS